MDLVKIGVDKLLSLPNVHRRNAFLDVRVVVMLDNGVLLVSKAQKVAQFADLGGCSFFAIRPVTIDYERWLDLTHP